MPPYTQSAQTHNSTVQGYFVSAGLSPQQVIGVSINTLVEGHENLGGTADPVFKGYTSILQRGVEGVPVVDSSASAMVRGDGSGGGPLYIAQEQVYWPAFPHTVVDDAHNLQSLVNDPVRFPAYVAQLPTATRGGQSHFRFSHRMTFWMARSFATSMRMPLNSISLMRFANFLPLTHSPDEIPRPNRVRRRMFVRSVGSRRLGRRRVRQRDRPGVRISVRNPSARGSYRHIATVWGLRWSTRLPLCDRA